MAFTAESDRIRQVAEILARIEAAHYDVFHYYKFGRYRAGGFETPYFLLSHCSHVMFSLWLADQESGGTLLDSVSLPAAFTSGQDFKWLRYVEYSRRMVHADSVEEHIKNEPKWFVFWVQTLESLDMAGSGCFQEFAQGLLKHVEDQVFLEHKTNRKETARLEALMQDDTTSRLLLRSITVLEDLARSIIARLGTVDAGSHSSEQIVAIIGLLCRIRRTVICETPAKGPYIPSVDKRWGTPRLLGLLERHGTHGSLTVVPKRDGSGIVCRCDRMSGNEVKSRQWMLQTHRLRHPYEEELFETWSYHEGEYMESPCGPSESKACWTLQAEEAAYLENLARQADILLGRLGEYPVYQKMVEVVAGVVRDNGRRWKPGELSWTHISELDQVVKRLKLVCREAKVVGGDNPAHWAIAKAWPPADASTDASTDASVNAQEPQEREPVAVEA